MILSSKKLKDSFIVHNNNIDRMNASSIKKRAFMLYSKKVNHVFFDLFIKEYALEKLGIPENRAFLLPYPLNSNDAITEKKYDCVGISNSNDDEWIKEIINIETTTEPFKKNRCHVILRSKKFTYDNGWLVVKNGWMDDSEYNNYINKAKCIFLPFPKTFQYRMSGSLVDAFSNRTAVIGTWIPVFQKYAQKYKHICRITNSPSDFCEQVIKSQNEQNGYIEFQDFIDSHSKHNVLESLKKMFKK
jgi:hypothetical protein